MAILQGILALGLLICPLAGMVCLFILIKSDELNVETIETPHYDEFYLKQYRSSVRCMCDYVQDNGRFEVYSSEYTVWRSGIKSANIKDMAIFITSVRNMYRPNKYELILQTSIPLERLESLYTSIIYRIIILRKDRKEIEPMDDKQKILNDIEEAQRKLDEARKKLDEYNTGYKRFKPTKNETYYHVASNGMSGQDWWNDDFITDIKRYDSYNCFKNREEAEAEAEKILVRRMLEDIARRLNKGRKISWTSSSRNYFIFFDNTSGKLTQDYNVLCQQSTVYCLDENFLNVAKREIGEDKLIKYIRGEG